MIRSSILVADCRIRFFFRQNEISTILKRLGCAQPRSPQKGSLRARSGESIIKGNHNETLRVGNRSEAGGNRGIQEVSFGGLARYLGYDQKVQYPQLFHLPQR